MSKAWLSFRLLTITGARDRLLLQQMDSSPNNSVVVLDHCGDGLDVAKLRVSGVDTVNTNDCRREVQFHFASCGRCLVHDITTGFGSN